VTEKLYSRMNAFVVPIVFGRDSYVNLNLPENSVIFVDDFCSVEALAEYLTFLHGNFTAYARYFKWRQKFQVWRLDLLSNIPSLVSTLRRLRTVFVQKTWRTSADFVACVVNCTERQGWRKCWTMCRIGGTNKPIATSLWFRRFCPENGVKDSLGHLIRAMLGAIGQNSKF